MPILNGLTKGHEAEFSLVGKPISDVSLQGQNILYASMTGNSIMNFVPFGSLSST